MTFFARASVRFILPAFCAVFFGQEVFGSSALVRTITGSPRITLHGKPLKVKKGDLIPDNAIVRTSQTDSIDIYFDDSARLISLGPNSQMRIELPTRSVVLDRGEVVGSVRKKSGAEPLPPVSIRTPMGVTTVSRGDFSVNTMQQEISVLSGSATYQSAGSGPRAELEISAGKTLIEDKTAPKPVVNQLSADSAARLLRSVDRVVTAAAPPGATRDFKDASNVAYISNETQAAPGTGTPGYWKTHPEAWPTSSVVIGGQTYTVSQAIGKMGTNKKDRTYTMFQDLVSAQLNVTVGNASSCIASTIASANQWMTAHPVGSNVSGSSSAWAQGDPIHQLLDDYNNGRLCAPHRN